MRLFSLRFMRLSLCIALTAIFSIVVHGQFKAGVQGVVLDIAGAVVPGATVTLTNKETNQTQQVTTSNEGFYRFSALPPGMYVITVEQQSFKKKVVDNVKIDAESVRGVDVQLEAGGIAEVVTVTADSVPLQTEDANIRKTISTKEVLNLPQTGRDPYSLARTAPGVFGDNASASGGNRLLLPNNGTAGAGSGNDIFSTENQPQISANGQRVTSNNYQIDGTSVNSQTWGGAAVITPSQESVKEVVVTATTYSAEDGRNSGAQVKVVTQNGTNNWHGSAFFKLNDPSLNAFNKFPRTIGTRTVEGPRRVERKFKTYGGSFGGPISKDNLFFFFSYEAFRQNNPGSYFAYIDTPEFRQGIIAARPGTVTARLLQSAGVEPRVLRIIPTTCTTQETVALNATTRNNCRTVNGGLDIGSVGGAYGVYLPNASEPTGGGFDGIADLQYAELASESKSEGQQYFTRVDWNVTNKDKLAFSSFFVPTSAFNTDSSAQSRPVSDLTTDRLNYALGIIYSRNISATMINEARFNMTAWGFNEFESNPDLDFGLPRVEIEQIFASDRLRYGARRITTIFDEKQLDFRNTLTNIVGNHVLKFGGEYRKDLNGNAQLGIGRPLYTFVRAWNFANGTPIFQSIATDVNGKPTNANTKFNTSEMAFFVQDDWKFRPNLTLNLGLRWTYFAPISATDGVLGNLEPDSNGQLGGAKIVTNKTLYDKDLNNFGPQIGFAWTPRRFNEKMVIRGGGGIGYDRLPNALLANARRNPPNGRNFGFCCANAGSPFLGGRIAYVASTDGTVTGYPANPILGGVDQATGLPLSGGAEIYGAPRDFPTAYVIRYSLEGQYELPANLVGTLGYSGSQGHHFVRILPFHVTSPTINPLLGAVFFASPDVNTNYHAMLARLQGRLAKQFTFDANYRFAKSIDTVSFEGACACTNQSYPIDQSQERGPSDFDVRHNFVMTGIWEIPYFENPWGRTLFGGWQLSGILTYHTGFPWTPKINTNAVGPSGRGFGPLRPTSYNGTQPLGNSNSNFLQPGGLFAGSVPTTVFGTTIVGNTFAGNPPAIGRNTFRGPRYFSVDMAIAKKFQFGSSGFFGENASLDVRFNFFNIFNNLNLVPFNANSGPVTVTNATFATASGGQAGRVGEFQIRFSF